MFPDSKSLVETAQHVGKENQVIGTRPEDKALGLTGRQWLGVQPRASPALVELCCSSGQRLLDKCTSFKTCIKTYTSFPINPLLSILSTGLSAWGEALFPHPVRARSPCLVWATGQFPGQEEVTQCSQLRQREMVALSESRTSSGRSIR